MRLTNQNNKRSPLYTSKARKAAKDQTICEKGKDSDGAYRVRNRIDEGKRG